MRPFDDELEHSSDAQDELEEHRLIDEVCARLLAQPAVYANDPHEAVDVTVFEAGKQFRYSPASEALLRAAEAHLGFSLPPSLRALYSRVANGGSGLGPGHDFISLYGVEGGWVDQARVSRSGWRLHERIEAALARFPGRYVLSDEAPDGFMLIGAYVSDARSGRDVVLDRHTRRLYLMGAAGSIPSETGEELDLLSIEFLAPSLGEWFRRWLDPIAESAPAQGGALTTDCVDVSGLREPDRVWRGLYRFDAREPEEGPVSAPDDDPSLR